MRVLLADDNVDAAEALAMVLRMQGHQAWVVEDGLRALEQVERMPFDLIVLDLGMPRMDGLQAAARMRALPGGERLRLAALTGWGRDLDRDRTRQAGFNWHLIKPVDLALLEELLAGLPSVETKSV
jgi:CheY-like chemotaxis protein